MMKWHVPPTWLSLCLLAALCGGGPACAKGGKIWRNLADQVFHPVVPDIELANVLIPEVIAQDGQGYIWLGEESGLLRWDGYHFTTYQYDQGAPNGLQDDFIASLHRDAQGRLWIGTVSGGLARYDAGTDQIIAVPLEAGKAPLQYVWAIDDDGAGGIWAATGTGLFHLNAEQKIIGHVRHQASDPGSLPGDVVTAMLLDRHGHLWVGTSNGLARGTGDNTRFVGVQLPVEGGDPPKVLHLFEDSAGRIWAGTRHQGTFVVQPGTDEARIVPATIPGGADKAAPEITSITEVAPGNIWLGTYGRGILEVDADTLHARFIRHDPLVTSSLNSDIVRSLFRDNSGLVWIGTNQGLSQHSPGKGGILTVFGAAGRSSGLTDGDAGAVLIRPDGGLWVGTEGGGLNIFDASGKRTGVLQVGRVFCMTEAPAGGVLVGTNNGLFLADDAGQHINKLSMPERANSAGVFALHAIDGVVWLGGLDDGLWKLHVDSGGAVTVLRHETAAGLANANVRSIELLPDGKLAIGTDDGFDLLDRGTEKIEHIAADPANPQGLSGRHVMTFVADRQGRLWAGTDSAGISVMVGRDGAGKPRFRRLTVADGLPNDDIDKLLPDRQGRIWASTDNGFAVIDPADFSIEALRRADGVAVTAYWNGSGTTAPDGDLLFGGLGGLTVVEPENVAQWEYHPPLVVTSVRIGGKELRPHAPAASPFDGVLQIPPDANSLAVEFAALDYSAPTLNRYSYKLAGFDPDWIETDSAHRVANYTNLPPGDFTLFLRGSNRNGAWTQPVALHIRVLPAWFQTLWFRLAAAAAGIIAVVAVVQGRTLLLRQRQRELERQVADRTAELVKIQQQLHHFAFVDVLTSLPNRRAFNEFFRGMIEKASQQRTCFALLLVDLDGFKQVNDTLGHDAGDELLVTAAARMRECLGEQGFVARLGGDEFAILLEDISDHQAVETVCDRLVERLLQPASIARSTVTAGASVGAALFPGHGADSEELLRHVDLALYEAKRAGRGTWRWYKAAEQPAFVFADQKSASPIPRRATGSR
jgi:diguanylate cyclase (GGDEF)-like protein